MFCQSARWCGTTVVLMTLLSACNVVNVDLKRLNKGWAFMRVVVIIRPKCAVVTR